MFNLKIHAKKGKNTFSISKFIQKKAKLRKRMHIYLDFFAFISCAFVCIVNLKIHARKDKNAKKNCLIAKKAEMQKKVGVYLSLPIPINQTDY